jgi:thymidine phosphorylase
MAARQGVVTGFDNRRLARVAKLAGAPNDAAAGLVLHVRAGSPVEAGAPLFTVHADAPGQLTYALAYVAAHPDIIAIGAPA